MRRGCLCGGRDKRGWIGTRGSPAHMGEGEGASEDGLGGDIGQEVSHMPTPVCLKSPLSPRRRAPVPPKKGPPALTWMGWLEPYARSTSGRPYLAMSAFSTSGVMELLVEFMSLAGVTVSIRWSAGFSWSGQG